MILKWSSTKLLILVLIWNPRWLPIRYNIGSYGSYSWLFETTSQACIMLYIDDDMMIFYKILYFGDILISKMATTTEHSLT
jgi:hypothetical protein